MTPALGLDSLSDSQLLSRLTTLVKQQRRIESEVVAHISEIDARNLYLGKACCSMHAYCVEVLHLSNAEAYLRIAVARASRKFPLLLAMLADGRLHLSAIARLAPHLRHENADALLARAAWKSKREIERLVAELAPRPDVPGRMRKLPRSSRVRVPRQRINNVRTLSIGPRGHRIGPNRPRRRAPANYPRSGQRSWRPSRPNDTRLNLPPARRFTKSSSVSSR